jgi:hypothetical protein
VAQACAGSVLACAKQHRHVLGAWVKRPEHCRRVEARGLSDDGDSNGKR